MKHTNRRSFISGILVTLLVVGLVGTATAAVGKRVAELNYSDIKITLNGQPITPTDAAGNLVEPFSIDGTTYLPVRAVGNALGLDVKWDGATGTAALIGTSTEERNPGAMESEVLLDYVLVLNIFKEIEDLAEWGTSFSDAASFYVDIAFSKYSDADDYAESSTSLSARLSEDMPSFLRAVDGEISRVDALIGSVKPPYAVAFLNTAKADLATLKKSVQNLNDMFVGAIAYLSSGTEASFDKYLDNRKLAVKYSNTVSESATSNYNDLFEFILEVFEYM